MIRISIILTAISNLKIMRYLKNMDAEEIGKQSRVIELAKLQRQVS